jgi:hypothetical protein
VFQASLFKTVEALSPQSCPTRAVLQTPPIQSGLPPLYIFSPPHLPLPISPPPLSSPLRVLCASVFQTLHIRESISTHGSPSGPRRQVSPHEN